MALVCQTRSQSARAASEDLLTYCYKVLKRFPAVSCCNQASLRVEESPVSCRFSMLCPPFPASCPFMSTVALPGCLLPHRPHRADFPQRVPQAGLADYLQTCRTRGGSNG